jgi:ankyrin repeat protein
VTARFERDPHGTTAIHDAALRSDADVLAELLDAGGDPNVRTNDGRLAITRASGANAALLRARGAVDP